jgi:aryl-alcohol dehydrogenase-like predicted oxidoreductase
MRYTTFGRRTGLRVSEYVLGAANFGTGWATGADRDIAKVIFDRFAEAGGTAIDTSDTYQFGESEELLGEFLAADRDHFVVASKFTQSVGRTKDISSTGNSRKVIVRSLEGTLRRLGTDHLDLYWAHWPDQVTPIEEIVETFDDLVRAGKILHGGLSNFPAWRVATAAALSRSLVGVQFEYSLAERTAERELVPMAEGLGLGTVLWSPLGGGLLTGKYRRSDEGRLTTLKAVIQREDTEQKTAVLDALLAVAAEVSEPPSRVAVSWLRHRFAGSATAVLPIIGPRSPEQLEDYLAALSVSLTPDQYERLDAVSAPALGVPHDAGRGVLNGVLGGHSESFDRLSPVA